MLYIDTIFDFPFDPHERATILQNELIARATGESYNNEIYSDLRRFFMDDSIMRDLLPSFVRTCRDLDHFWGFIKNECDNYAGRRTIIRDALTPLFDHLEGANRAPADAAISDTLASFDPEGVHVVWSMCGRLPVGKGYFDIHANWSGAVMCPAC
jgi:hypothetical protein